MFGIPFVLGALEKKKKKKKEELFKEKKICFLKSNPIFYTDISRKFQNF